MPKRFTGLGGIGSGRFGRKPTPQDGPGPSLPGWIIEGDTVVQVAATHRYNITIDGDTVTSVEPV